MPVAEMLLDEFAKLLSETHRGQAIS